MVRFLTDENFNGQIVRGLRQRQPEIDLIRVQDTEIAGADDPLVLDWATCSHHTRSGNDDKIR